MDDVRAECKRRYGSPCIRIYAADMVTVVDTADCTTWCPALKRPIEIADPPPPAAEK